MAQDTGLRIDGSDVLTHPTAGNIRQWAGTIIQRQNPRYMASDYSSGTRRVFTIDGFLRALYDFSDKKFKLQAHNGVDWTTIQVLSAVQSFAIDAVLFLVFRWNAGLGLALDVGSTKYSQAATWTPQALPVNMELGADEMLNLETRVYDQFVSDIVIKSIRLGGI